MVYRLVSRLGQTRVMFSLRASDTARVNVSYDLTLNPANFPLNNAGWLEFSENVASQQLYISLTTITVKCLTHLQTHGLCRLRVPYSHQMR
jgi:hypothetical protein